MTITVDRKTVEITPGDSVLVAMLRAGLHPTGGGCLCLAGDCSHCIATVDGVAYTRTCQLPARDGAVVERQHASGAQPPLPEIDPGALERPEPAVQHHHCDVVVIGTGPAGRDAADVARRAGKRVVTLDARDGQQVAGLYPGPLVVAGTSDAVWHVHPCEEIVVATGAAEIQPVVPGAGLNGLVTARAAAALAEAGLDLGRLVVVGEPPPGLDAVPVEGELVRLEGDDAGAVVAVVTRDADGVETRRSCDTVTFGLGLHPRDALVRMGRGLPVRAVGDALRTGALPPCPKAGTVCACAAVDVEDLESVWQRGFHELELVKRATLAGTGTCQGMACLPHIRSFLQTKGRTLQAPFTARPLTRSLTVGEVAAGAHHRATLRTALHDEHLCAGAVMQRAGGWWRPWHYGDVEGEMRAVRESVSLGDVSTLGVFAVGGPDALAFLEWIYPTRVSTLKPGRARYALLLDERGYVADDGLIVRERTDTPRFYLTSTSAGSTFFELWLRDWAASRPFDVRIANLTQTVGAINVTGPRAAELLGRAGVGRLPPLSRYRWSEVAGVRCRVIRLSFTGELSYELHHAAADGPRLWRALTTLGADLGIRPHGLDALLRLRLEKGHIVVGQDTDFDSTPRRLGHGWAVDLGKETFLGRQAVLRTDQQPLDRQLVGLEMALPAPIEGETVWHRDDDGHYLGWVTSSTASAALGKAVMLAWVARVGGSLPDEVTIDGRPARRVATPFYDPKGRRSRGKVAVGGAEAVAAPGHTGEPAEDLGRFTRLDATRLVASPESLDALVVPEGAVALRIAPDEVLVTARVDPAAVGDGFAIVVRETGFAGTWADRAQVTAWVARHAVWPLPDTRPTLVQGALAGVPVKLWLEDRRALLVVPAPLAVDLAERLS